MEFRTQGNLGRVGTRRELEEKFDIGRGSEIETLCRAFQSSSSGRANVEEAD